MTPAFGVLGIPDTGAIGGMARDSVPGQARNKDAVLIQMRIEGLLFDPRSGMYILLLRDTRPDSNDTLPIWIGKPEADSIALALGKVATPRPLTHDLLANTLSSLQAKVVRIIVTDLRDNTYFANIEILVNNETVFVDSRPSDAVALAARTGAPIFVSESVIERQDNDELESWLRNLKPEDFGTMM